ncbi:hypothetical protein GOC31_27185 [Sinorhizobium meliloti]|nr:hypothetical protein [Sinorhizobium meliloti]MDX0252340.1 hypothetical protein [Sinorhizobium meliloti]
MPVSYQRPVIETDRSQYPALPNLVSAEELFCSFNDEPTVDLVMKKTGPTTQQYETTSRQLEPFGGVPKRTVTQHRMAKPLFRANELYAWNRNTF